jgi:hypothetical protein
MMWQLLVLRSNLNKSGLLNGEDPDPLKEYKGCKGIRFLGIER